jgi:hypothetical protein
MAARLEDFMIRKRIARLESALARPAESAPVDMAPVRAQLAFLLAGVGHRGRNPLERLASAMRVTPMRLWKLVATPGRKKFKAMYGALRPLQPDRPTGVRNVWRLKTSGAPKKLTTWRLRFGRNSFAMNFSTACARSALPSTATAGCRCAR